MLCQTRTSKMLMTVPANVAAVTANEFFKNTDNCFKVLSQIFLTISVVISNK